MTNRRGPDTRRILRTLRHDEFLSAALHDRPTLIREVFVALRGSGCCYTNEEILECALELVENPPDVLPDTALLLRLARNANLENANADNEPLDRWDVARYSPPFKQGWLVHALALNGPLTLRELLCLRAFDFWTPPDEAVAQLLRRARLSGAVIFCDGRYSLP